MTETDLGIDLAFGDYRIFFGNRHANVATLQKVRPEFKYLRAKQIHSDVIREVDRQTPDLTLQGDGLVTKEKNLALCSISADCTPVLVAAPGTPWIAAFHAGWRGVASRLIPMGLQQLIGKGAQAEKIRIWIGPHILQPSFVVHADVRDQILKSRPPKQSSGPVETWDNGSLEATDDLCRAGEQPGTFHISLVNVLLEQISALDVPLENVEMQLCDTKTDLRFHSARRDKELSGRQVSWISRINI